MHIILRLALTIRRLKHYKRKKSNVGKKKQPNIINKFKLLRKHLQIHFLKKKVNHQAYADVLNLGDVMGYIEISKINIKLPIYQGTSEEVLGRGIGHLDFSSLPVGGESTHTILTGHRGLPSAKLFTDLDKLSKGDLFYIHSLDKVLAYKVDQIKVVLPHETDDLQIVENKDYTTLITCTPYGVNTNRLLVRGERVELNKKEKQKVSTEIFIFNKWTVIVTILLLCVLLVVIYKKKLTR
ncbi:class C sortase [Bacillus thuringiensis]|uniref:class C sortase n=1 Tax=Bacillus thuringiensis TaxID=1428 RepID=UPI0030F47D49